MRFSSLCLLLLCIGCAAGPPPQWKGVSASAEASSDYEASLATWTRHAAHYQALEGRLFVTATCFSPSFAMAYAQQRARRQGLPQAETTLLQRQLVRAAENEIRFFMAVSTYNDHWNDLEDPKSTLRLRLFHGDDGRFIEPLRIERISEDELADLRLFFPYATPLTVAYAVIFPAPATPHRLRLRVAGPPAVVDLEWEAR